LGLVESEAGRLQDLKERSYEQKNLYLQTQEIEMGLLDEMARVEEEENLYY
jgi:hypothetical protein